MPDNITAHYSMLSPSIPFIPPARPCARLSYFGFAGEVTVNNGAATLNVGPFAKTQFTAAKQQVVKEPLGVNLNCVAKRLR
ncbi:hypothetical protein [Rahnella sikkimica]|uniref:Uncharacterized protein n=1 Tax=Rahnella sikkimica TaxID=1805933 RepID=A0A2L1UN93_9GAMM|nr:hypothetical protein [Rahnella sikkimica]AVF34403.1 hypothetical protein BV494_05445 [Rahnella sikkimica]